MERELMYVVSTIIMLSTFIFVQGLMFLGIISILVFFSVMWINKSLAPPPEDGSEHTSIKSLCGCSLKV